MIQLKENAGISVGILTAMAVIAGFTVANCYYNQPLLELIRADLHVSEAQANLITVITQIGYALGLFFIIPGQSENSVAILLSGYSFVSLRHETMASITDSIS